MKQQVLLSLSFLLVACAASPQPAPLRDRPEASPLEVVRRGGDGVASLRATFVSHLHRGDLSERARGVLLVSRPQRVRLRLSSFFGLTILDYTSDSGDDRLWLASESRLLTGDEMARSGWFSTESARWIFLRDGPWLRHDCVQVAAGGETLVECRDPYGRVAYRGYVEQGSGLLSREIVFDEDTARLTVEYRNYRTIDGVRLPYQIEWSEGSTGVRVEIDVDRYDVDPVLGPELFAPVQS